MKIVFLFLILIGMMPFAFADSTNSYEETFLETNDFFLTYTPHGIVKLDKLTCSFEFYQNYTSSGFLFSDSIVPKIANDGTENWNSIASINNALCEAYGSVDYLVAKKHVPNVGLVEYKYINLDSEWKTQLEATNLSTQTNKKFGFTQTIDINRDIIKFGGANRNLDNFNGVTFDRAFLVSNQAKVFDFLNEFLFDVGLGFDRLQSVYIEDIGPNKSKIAFNYFQDAQVLLPAQLLIIDPTITQTTGGGTANIFDATQYAAGEKLETASAQLIGSRLESLDVWLQKSGSPTGSATGRIYSGAGVLQETSTNSLDVSTLTGTYAQHSFTFTGSHVLAENDRIIVYYDAGDGANFVQVERSTTDVYDSTNSIFTRFVGSAWDDSGTTQDLKFIIVYNDVPPPDAVDDLSVVSTGYTNIYVDWTAPSAGGGNQQIIGYQLNVTTPWTNNPTVYVNDTGTTDTEYNITGLIEDTPYSIRVSAWANVTNGHPYNNATGNIVNATTQTSPTMDVISESIGVVGDTARLSGYVNVLSGGSSANLTSIQILLNSTVINTNSTIQNSTGTPYGVNIGPFWIRMGTDQVYEFEIKTTLQNTIETITNSSYLYDTREYNPSYFPAIDNPASQGYVNATVERFDNENGILLKVNRLSVLTGDTWQIECIAQTNSEATQTKNQSQTWQGTWSNTTNTGYFNTTFTGFTNSHAYITCFNEDVLFTLTDFTSSSLALLGIELFDQSYGSMIGVPVGIFFLVMTAGMANKRTAPPFIIVVTGIAGTMATIGFFSFEPIVWGLALVTAMLGIFVNQKIF